MFENYIYCNRKLIISYISQIKNNPKAKKVNLELSLPFLKISSNFEFNKDIKELSDEELCILFESIFQKYNGLYYFDLDENNDEYSENHLIKNTFIKKNAQFTVPHIAEQLDAIRGLSSLKGLIGDKMKELIAQYDLSQNALNYVLDNNNAIIPIYTESDNNIYYFNFDNNNEDVIEKLDDNITVVGKIKNAKTGRVKVFDLLKEVFNVNRSMRRQMPKNDEDKTIVYLEADNVYEIEILYITA